MLMMNSEADKQRIMENLPKLKDKAEFKGISITEDYTLAERQMLTECNTNWYIISRNKKY